MKNENTITPEPVEKSQPKWPLAVIAAVLVFLFWLGTGGGAGGSSPAATVQSDRYQTSEAQSIVRGLRQMEEAAWVDWTRNTVIVGMEVRPGDAQQLANAWAVQLSRAWDFGAHVYIVPADAGPASSVGRYWVTATARRGALR